MLSKQVYCPQYLLSRSSTQPQASQKRLPPPASYGSLGCFPDSASRNHLLCFAFSLLLIICFSPQPFSLCARWASWYCCSFLYATLCHGKQIQPTLEIWPQLSSPCSEALGSSHFLAQLIFRERRHWEGDVRWSLSAVINIAMLDILLVMN